MVLNTNVMFIFQKSVFLQKLLLSKTSPRFPHSHLKGCIGYLHHEEVILVVMDSLTGRGHHRA
jgi:hypothetical protein